MLTAVEINCDKSLSSKVWGISEKISKSESAVAVVEGG